MIKLFLISALLLTSISGFAKNCGKVKYVETVDVNGSVNVTLDNGTALSINPEFRPAELTIIQIAISTNKPVCEDEMSGQQYVKKLSVKL